MGCGVAGDAQVVEKASHFPFDQPLRLQASDQGQLGFLDAGEDPKARGHLLGQPLPQLPQLDQRRIGILREIAFRQQPQAEQLLVVAAQLGEVGGHCCGWFGRYGGGGRVLGVGAGLSLIPFQIDKPIEKAQCGHFQLDWPAELWS